MQPARGRRYASLSAVALLIAAALAGCGQSCPELTCSDRVTFQPTDSASAVWGEGQFEFEACVDDLCESAKLTIGLNGPRGQMPEVSAESGTFDPDEPHGVTLSVADADGILYFTSQPAVEFEEFKPNGPRCAPTCAIALIAIDPTAP